MIPTLDTVRALIARALDLSGSSEEERRTSALIAVRLIHAHGLLEPRVRYIELDEPPRRVIASRFAGWCGRCGGSYDIGAMVAWARGHAALCMACHRRESEAA
jgi:hypothetical protein